MKGIKKIVFLSLMTLFYFNCSNKSQEQNIRNKTKESQKNIIFINADDLSAATLGIYGQKIIKTPRLDQMAKEGLLFKNGYSPATTCGPSRVALLLGKHLGHLPYRRNNGDLCRAYKAALCYPELLQKRGYKTALFGKASNAKHIFGRPVSDLPSHNGFDLFIGTLLDGPAHQFYLDGKTAPQSNHPNHLWKGENEWWVTKYNISPKRYTQNEYIDLALDFIEGNKENPFFLYLPLQIPHWELVVPKKGEEDYHAADEGLLEQYLNKDGTSKFKETPYLGRGDFQRPEPMPKATYAAMVSRLDRDVGKILDKLSILGLKENTLVVFTADNGFAGIPGGDPFQATGGRRGSKAHLYEGGIKVPYIFWGAEVYQGEIEAPIVGYDLAPTILDFANISDKLETDGISWKTTLLNGVIPERKWIYWENYHGKTRQAILIDGRYKIIKSEVSPKKYQVALYDLKEDKREVKDLSSEEQYKEVLEVAQKIFKQEHEPNENFVIL